MDKLTYGVGYFVNKSDISIAVECMNQEYPNVHFQVSENGEGRYKVTVSSIYNKIIPYNIMVIFKSEVSVLYRSARLIQKLSKGV